MKHQLFGFSLLLAITTAPQTEARAALVINNSDIVAGHYIYDLTFAETQNSTVFNNDVFFQSRISVMQEGGVTNFVTPDPSDNSGYTTASLVYKFDFSTTDFRPVSLDLYDNIFAFYHPSVAETVVTSYSLDGINYTPIHTASTVGQTTSQSANGFVTIDLSSQPTAVYYQVEFTADTSTFGYGYLGAQWNRLEAPSQPFEADFTVVAVPEPATAGLLGLAALICARPFLRRGTRRLS